MLTTVIIVSVKMLLVTRISIMLFRTRITLVIALSAVIIIAVTVVIRSR